MDIRGEEDHEFSGLDRNPIGGGKLCKGDILFHREGHFLWEIRQRLPAHPFNPAEGDLDVNVFAMALGGDFCLGSHIDFLDIHEGLAIWEDFVLAQRKCAQVGSFKPFGDFHEPGMKSLVFGKLGEGVVNHR